MNNFSTTTLKSQLTFKNVFSYEKQKYFYREPDNENYFSSAVIPGMLRRNLKSLENLQNTSTIAFQWGDNLLLEAGIRYENVKLNGENEYNHGLVLIQKAMNDN